MHLMTLSLIVTLFSSVLISASEQKYTITEAGGRIFLLDVQEGAVYRYYFNNVNDQGWDQTEFQIGIYDNKRYYKKTPKGELLSSPSKQNSQKDQK